MSDVILARIYMVMVSISSNGEVVGEVLDHYDDPYECVLNGQYEESEAPFGVGFVCVEDVVYNDKQ